MPHNNAITDTVPMRLTELDMGSIKCVIKADSRHIIPLGGVHGGLAATVLDSVTGCALHTILEAGVGYGTVDINIKMMRPMPLNEELQAEGKLYTHATSTCLILRGTAA